jgi:hypothetical protein
MGRAIWARAIFAVALLGCGGTGTGGTGTGGQGATHTPSTHAIDMAQRHVTVNTSISIGPFSVPDGATVTYTVTDMPTGVAADTMNIAVASDAMVQAGTTPLTGFGVNNGVGSATATTVPLPAGAYDLVAFCNNLVDDCSFSDTITAFY